MEVLHWLAGKWTILVAIVFFGLIIMLHETGHFAFAKLFKVKVNEFSLGMGPKILSRKKGETAYSWRLFPIGGFVSMEGEDEESDDERAFVNKPCWQRIIIVAAGAVVNIILGLLITAIMLSMASSSLSGTRQVNFFREKNSSTGQVEKLKEFSGLKSGDIFKKIDGKTVLYYEDIYFLASRDFDSDGKFTAVVERGGKNITLESVETQAISKMTIVGVPRTPLTVIADTFKESVSISRMVYLSLFDMITGKYSFKDVSGPVGVVDYVSQTAQASHATRDYSGLLRMMALITINIGLFNLLPVPALDGGRLLFLLIELVRRKPVSRKYEAWVHAVGMVLLFGFMIAVSAKDIWMLIKG